jgi:hypothetical protein
VDNGADGLQSLGHAAKIRSATTRNGDLLKPHDPMGEHDGMARR